MNLNQLIIAFLAPRDPAAYTEVTIAQRLNKSRMLDRHCTVEEVANSLRDLNRMGFVTMQMNKLDDSAVWKISPEGFKEWVLEGRVTVV